MTDLAEQLGIELKSFYVKVEEFPSNQTRQDMLDRCVSLGAEAVEGVNGDVVRSNSYFSLYDPRGYHIVGVARDMETLMTTDLCCMDYDDCLHYAQMLEYLQLQEHEVDGVLRLVGKETLSSSREVECCEEDPDGWIEWSGGECPVQWNTKVDVILSDQSNHIDTIADCWDWSTYPPVTIIKYRISKETSEAPTEPVEDDLSNSLPKVDPTLEKLLHLVTVAYKGKTIYFMDDYGSYEEDGEFMQTIQEVVSSIDCMGVEEEMQQLSLDKQIEEKQNELNELIKQREGK